MASKIPPNKRGKWQKPASHGMGQRHQALPMPRRQKQPTLFEQAITCGTFRIIANRIAAWEPIYERSNSGMVLNTVRIIVSGVVAPIMLGAIDGAIFLAEISDTKHATEILARAAVDRVTDHMPDHVLQG